jgi:hypothetical protein
LYKAIISMAPAGVSRESSVAFIYSHFILITRAFYLKKMINRDFNNNLTGGKVLLQEEVTSMKELGCYYVSLYFKNL